MSKSFVLGAILGAVGAWLPDAYTTYNALQDNPDHAKALIGIHACYILLFLAVLWFIYDESK